MNTISQQVVFNLQSIETINKQYYEQKRVLENAYHKKVHEHTSFIYDLEQQYTELACSIAEESGQCPTSRWGHALPPTEVTVKEEGLQLMWEDSHPYHASSYHYFTATWQQLIQGESHATHES